MSEDGWHWAAPSDPRQPELARITIPQLDRLFHEAASRAARMAAEVTHSARRTVWMSLLDRLRSERMAEAAAPRYDFRFDGLINGVRQTYHFEVNSIAPAVTGDGPPAGPVVTSETNLRMLAPCKCGQSSYATLWALLMGRRPEPPKPDPFRVVVDGTCGAKVSPQARRGELDELLTLVALVLVCGPAILLPLLIGLRPIYVGYVPPTWACVCGSERLAGPVVPRGPEPLPAELRRPGTARPTSRLGHPYSFVLSA